MSCEEFSCGANEKNREILSQDFQRPYRRIEYLPNSNLEHYMFGKNVSKYTSTPPYVFTF
jgi:hypothetical protein